MGMNYYIQRKTTQVQREVLADLKCDLPRLHIGKSSHGWTFSFHAVSKDEADKFGIHPVNSLQDWKNVMGTGQFEIVNEESEVIDTGIFYAKVESKRTEKNNHTKYLMENEYGDSRSYGAKFCFLDAEGHSFNLGEFS